MSMIVSINMGALAPYIGSIIITIAWALLGYGSSGETFDSSKFATTMGVEVVALIGAAFTGSAWVTLITPSLVAAFVSKVVSWFQKEEAARIAKALTPSTTTATTSTATTTPAATTASS